jgi:hypothetical protein
VDKIFDGVQHQQLAAAAAAAGGGDEAAELTPEQFASMKRDVEQLGEQQQQHAGQTVSGLHCAAAVLHPMSFNAFVAQ